MVLLLLSVVACDDAGKDDTGPAVEETGPAIVDADGDGVPEGADCDDTDEYTYPGALELPYDGEDQDCDGEDVNDVDGDGYVGVGGGGDDCNDANPDVHPGAEVICYDLLDETCDGENWSQYDCDSDGFDVTADCGDEDPAIFPGADDPWYDGVDSNCDGLDDHDQDQDGETTLASGGTDCDDVDPLVNSLADEVWDGVDNDCAGGADVLSSRNTSSAWYGDNSLTEALFAWDFAPVDDLDGDGMRDVVVGVLGYAKFTGRAYVLPYGDDLEVPADTALATIEATSGYLGSAVGTVRGPDGDTMVAIAEAQGATIYLFDTASLTGGASLTGADAAASITSASYYLGGDLAAWDDGAGGQSLLVSSFEVEGGGTYVGLYPGAALAGVVPTTTATWSVELTGDAYDANVLGDHDGDGLDEIGVAATTSLGTVRAYLYTGADVSAGVTAPAGLSGFTGHLLLGAAPDLDGDGYEELLVSDWEADGTATAGGKVWVLGGPEALSGGAVGDLAFATISGATEEGDLRACSGHADLDGDTVVDVLTCAPGDGLSAVRGAVSWVSGTALAGGGDHAPNTDGPSFGSVGYDDEFGKDALPDDVDADGDLDLWISAPSSPGGLVLYLRE